MSAYVENLPPDRLISAPQRRVAVEGLRPDLRLDAARVHQHPIVWSAGAILAERVRVTLAS
jgi:hypothetical protein